MPNRRPPPKQTKPQRKQRARGRSQQRNEESKLAAASSRIQRIEAQRITQRVAEVLGQPGDELQPFHKACAAINARPAATTSTRGRGAKHAQRATLRQQFRAAFLAALDSELAAEWEETQSRLQQCSGAELQRAGLCIQNLTARQDASVFKCVNNELLHVLALHEFLVHDVAHVDHILNHASMSLNHASMSLNILNHASMSHSGTSSSA